MSIQSDPVAPRVNDNVVLANMGFDPGASPFQSEMITKTLICRDIPDHTICHTNCLCFSYSPPLLLLLTTHLTTHHTSDSPP